MGSKRSVRHVARTTKIESLEVRQMFSATALSGLVGGGEQHSIAEPSVEQHAATNADFWYDTNLDRQRDVMFRNIEQTLASAHQITGVTQARTDYGFYGFGQTVAVIDSGIAWDHPSLGGGLGADFRVVGGWDFTEENDANPYDDGPAGAHGTHVAGIVGATANSSGDAGVAPGVDLVGLRVFNDQGAGYFSWVEKALRWVHDNRNSFANPITTVNLSLGTAWNAATVPNWAMLEDEFAQLEADGIFIAVAAGNSFSTYNASGLSYPAASSHVVPVMSVDDTGLLSNFSQRHSRAIAAPGRSIRSTVPDYVGNQNGKIDDWANFSGTSMASPYVAGASVLVREAMQFVGYANITQDVIYDHMLATADQFFDSATNQYYNRLNVAAALDALIPDDEFGSTVATAYELGTISAAGTEVKGLIGKRDDIDYFQFIAAATGMVTFTADTTHGLEAVWFGDGVIGTDGNTFTLNVVAGRTYQVGLGSRTGIGYFDLTITAEYGPSFVDWGTVRNEVKSDLVVVGQAWFRVSASQSGYVTAKLLHSAGGNEVGLAWYDANMQPLASRLSASGISRVDSWAETGDALYLCVTGDCSDVDIQVVNQVTFNGAVAHVTGTTAADQFTFSVDSTHLNISVNGVAYKFDRTVVTQIEINGEAGADTIRMTGTLGDDTAVMSPREVTLTGSGFSVLASDIEYVTINGLAGHDKVTLYDSAGSDIFGGWSHKAIMYGANYSNTVEGFTSTIAHSLLGGIDQARFYDSVGNDIYGAWSNKAVMYGAGYCNTVHGFANTTAYSTMGGKDQARFYDSGGDDIYGAWSHKAIMYGANYANTAQGFTSTVAYSTLGGRDQARFYDSAGNDSFAAWSNRAAMLGVDYANNAYGFCSAIAYSTLGGWDRAYLYDSAANNKVVAAAWGAYLSGNGFRNDACGFREISAYLVNGREDDVSVAATDYVFQLIEQPG